MKTEDKPIITVPISGNTYPVRAALYKLGGKWDAEAKAWMVPEDKAEEAQRIVRDAPKVEITRHYRCKVCGVHASRRVRIYRSGECQDCYEERKMGY
jgi:hypothetical protein